MTSPELFPNSDVPKCTLTSGNVFFLLQTARSARDSLAEIVRTIERYGGRGMELHALSIAATNDAEILRHRLATEYEIKSRMEYPKKRR